jgi:CheY-like chemotaxis protein
MPVIAANAKEVQAILSGSESFDVAIIDDTLSDMDGVTLADNIKERLGDKAPPIILLYDLGMRVDPGHNLAATIAKPVKSSQLLSTISSIIPSEEGASIKKEIVTTDEQALGATIARLKVELPQHTLRILVAEDNSVNQKVIISMLKSLGYRADLAASGIEVLEALGRQPYDLIFMDVQMPVMDGLEATRKIRSRFSQFGPKSKKLEPIIIALTAHALKGDKERCIEAGMNDYISKPVKLGDLRAIIEFYKIKKKI